MQDYKGPSVWSESETRASRDFVLAHSDRIKLFIGLHSYGQLVLLPYGDTEEYPPDIDDMLALTNEVKGCSSSCCCFKLFIVSTCTCFTSEEFFFFDFTGCCFLPKFQLNVFFEF